MRNRAGSLWRSTAFRQSILYFALLALTAGGVIAYISWHTRVTLHRQTVETVDAEVRGLAEQYSTGGIRTLVSLVERRSRNPDNSVYLITTFRGESLAGNIRALPPGTLDQPGQHTLRYGRITEDAQPEEGTAVVQVFVLPGGFRLVVGRDTSERDRFLEIVERAGWYAGLLVLVLGIGGGYLIAKRTLSRIDAVSDTSRRIMAGDLNERIALHGSGDEFDRLAANLNEMLDRIARLMAGMREVSDNVAHDLRTPLTRLRGRMEAALRSGDEATMREALEEGLSDTANLIATFNALLTIARAESGSTDTQKQPVAARALLIEIAELYEPAAEEAGMRLLVTGDTEATVLGNRELLAQALANLTENAIRHGRPADGGVGEIRLSLEQAERTVRLVVTDTGSGVPPDDRKRV
ncbi:MAG: HAMP domain-containing protein, partial [Flavobacteriaceae bacterium]